MSALREAPTPLVLLFTSRGLLTSLRSGDSGGAAVNLA